VRLDDKIDFQRYAKKNGQGNGLATNHFVRRFVYRIRGAVVGWKWAACRAHEYLSDSPRVHAVINGATRTKRAIATRTQTARIANDIRDCEARTLALPVDLVLWILALEILAKERLARGKHKSLISCRRRRRFRFSMPVIYRFLEWMEKKVLHDMGKGWREKKIDVM
jgi:hypothetical protein